MKLSNKICFLQKVNNDTLVLVVFRVLHGQRPYWWVPESGLYPANSTVLQQYSLTCETGPGVVILYCLLAFS